MFAQRFLAGYFTWRLARDRLGVGVLPSLCAGAAYAVFSQNTINADWAGPTLYDGLSLACLPLALWALDDSSGWSHRRRLVVGAGLGLLLGLTSHYSGAVFVVLAIGAWLLLRRRRSLWDAASVFALFAALWIVAEVPAIWSSMLNSPLSNRADWADRALSAGGAMSRQWSYVFGILKDNLVMAAAAVLGLVAARFRDRRLVVALAATSAIVIVILATGVWLMGYRRYAGPLSGFQIDRFYLLLPFALIMSGAIGLDAFMTKPRGRSPQDGRRPALVLGVALLVLLLVGPLTSARAQLRIVREMRAGSTFAVVYERPELQLLAGEVSGDAGFRVATVYAPQAFGEAPDSYWPFLFGPLPAYAWAYGLETVDGYVQMYPERYQRFWGLVAARGLAQDKAMLDSFWDWGNRVYLFLPDTGDQTSAAADLAGFCDPDLLSLANVRYLISPVRLIGPGLTPISGDGTGEPWPLFVYENSRVLSRFFLTRSIRALPDSTAVLDAMAHASAEELASVAYVETKDSNALGLSRDRGSAGSVDVLRSEADVVSLSVTADAPGFLVTSMTYSPYWRAFIDGRETDIVPTDAAFMGVAIPLGTHSLELRYDPPYAWLFPG